MDKADLVHRFTYHDRSDGKPLVFEHVRARALELAVDLDTWCPDGREKSLAMTHLEEVVFWANASIARRP